MFRLINNDLPLSASTPVREGFPGFKVMMGGDFIAGPLLRVENQDPNAIAPSPPVAVLDYYQVQLNYLGTTVSGDLQSSFPAIDSYAISDNNCLNLLVKDPSKTVRITFSAPNSQFLVLPESFVTVEVRDSRSQPVMFTQEAERLVVDALPAEALTIIAELNISELSSQAEVLVFFEDRLSIVTSAEWQARRYSPAQEDLNPQLGEFLAGNCFIWLFT